ncbi:MAG: transposase, partial [Anaerolineales bacterium]
MSSSRDWIRATELDTSVVAARSARVSFLRFLGFSLGDRTPDENTIRHYRNRMTEPGTLKWVMKAFDWQLHKKGYIPMSGQILDASLVPA